jgi:cyclophilin family peptidyl-prolyl cis-trans isomerase
MKPLLTCLALATFLFSTTLSVQAADAAKKPASKETATASKDKEAKEGVAKEAPAALLPRVRIQTNMGDMMLELYDTKAPKTVENFLGYVREGAYDGTLFHRVISNFMIQGGAYGNDYKPRYTRAAIPAESTNGLKNERGTIAMAREYDPNSATNQFFINVVDNRILNHHSPKPGHWGYTVFGKITEGLDVLDRIRNTPTGPGGQFPTDVPQTQVMIKKISIEPPAPPYVVASAEEDVKKDVKDTKKTKKKTTDKSSKKPASKTTKSEPKPDPSVKSVSLPASKTSTATAPATAKDDRTKPN